MFDLSRLASTVALLVLTVALSGCAAFVTNTQNDIFGRPAPANWKLQKFSDNNILQCIASDTGACDERLKNLVSGEIISAASRIEMLRGLDSTTPVTPESVANGYTSLRELSSSVRRPGAGVSAQQALQSKFNASPETLLLFAQLLDLAAADSSRPQAVASMSSVAGAKSAMKALVHNDACVELDKIRANSTGASGSSSFIISKESFKECLEQTQDATTLDGWSALSAHYISTFIAEAKKIEGLGTTKEEEQRKLKILIKEAIATHLIGSYMKAYFSNGNIFAVDLKLGQLKSDAVNALKKNLYTDQAADQATDQVIDALADKLLQQDRRIKAR